MSVQPAGHPDPAETYEVIHASGEALEQAEIESTLAAHDEWVAAGCPGARSHEDVMAELLGSNQ